MAESGRRIAILGAGQIGESLLAGLLSSGWRKPEEIVVTGRREERIDELAERYGVGDDALEHRSRLRRRDGRDRRQAAGLRRAPGRDRRAPLAEQTVLSVAAAIPTAQIERASARRACPCCARCRTRPPRSTRASPGSAPARTRATSTSRWPRRCSPHVGRVVRVPEPYMDAVTAVSGSGPAYFALLAEAMIEAGILLGLSREVSTELVVQTMFGTAKLLRDEKMHPVELREMVTSPGGTTIRAIRELEQRRVRAAFLNAIQAAMERSREARRRRAVNAVELPGLRHAAATRRRGRSPRRPPAPAGTSPCPEATLGPALRSSRRARADWAAGGCGGATSAACRPTTSARTTGSCGARCSTGSSGRRRCTGSRASSAAKRPRTRTTRSSRA